MKTVSPWFVFVTLTLASTLQAAPLPTETSLTLSDISVVHTNHNQVEVSVRISSVNAAVKVSAVEY